MKLFVSVQFLNFELYWLVFILVLKGIIWLLFRTNFEFNNVSSERLSILKTYLNCYSQTNIINNKTVF